MALVLTADLGNSRLKLCVWETASDEVVARATLDAQGRDEIERAVGEFAREHAPIDAAALSSVAAADLDASVMDALRLAGIERVLVAPDCGLDIDVREPARVGRDRLYAARGSLAHTGASEHELIVVDAGTALTVDAVLSQDSARARASSNARACFLGGAIAPGPTLLARALAEHTARLPRIEPRVDAVPLGRDTESAVQSGVVVGFRGAAIELARRIAHTAEFRAPVVVVTGGAAAFLADLFRGPEFARVVHDPDLVQRGLCASLRAAISR